MSEIVTSEPVTEPVIAVTARAAAEISSMMALPENAGKSLRVYVEQGGCSGMQYGMVFDERREGDLTPGALKSPIPTPKKVAVAENLSQLERAETPGKATMPFRVMRNGFLTASGR